MLWLLRFQRLASAILACRRNERGISWHLSGASSYHLEAQTSMARQAVDKALVKHRRRCPEAATAPDLDAVLNVIQCQAGRRLAKYLAGGTITRIAITRDLHT